MLSFVQSLDEEGLYAAVCIWTSHHGWCLIQQLFGHVYRIPQRSLHTLCPGVGGSLQSIRPSVGGSLQTVCPSVGGVKMTEQKPPYSRCPFIHLSTFCATVIRF